MLKPELNEGEVYVGAIINDDGTGNHIILLPGDNNDAGWHDQLEWAKSIDGDLPTRTEQALLFECHRDRFKRDWYWSNQQHSKEVGWAWFQDFVYGAQRDRLTHNKLRARAIRRVVIQP